ncbi:CD59 glycoprotein [Hyla sarda]|uniref:CD59 glycoprotein n=1 Tax=Hyla sarda TaxID=327740 RepID=UPI0024C28B22|nr:CD59 glycoprotein [Hyla sarda]
MGSTGNCCVALAVVLVLLTVCSTGQALQCYNCAQWSLSKCESTTTCGSSTNGCMRITRTDGSTQYGCRAYDKCSSEIIGPELNIQNFQLHCCQKDLCNSGYMSHPSAVLLLSLAVVLLVIMS